MQMIKGYAVVTEDGHVTIEVPPEIAPGTHEIVLVIAEKVLKPEEIAPTRQPAGLEGFPAHDIGPWPEDLSLRREDMYDDRGAWRDEEAHDANN